jgi:ribosomal-protein-alanine N-acetyltransferase
MKEGFELVFRFAFGKGNRDLKLHRLEADIQPKNEASLGLARAVGFEREGASCAYVLLNDRWRDHERYAITSEKVVSRSVIGRDEVEYPPPLGNQLIDAS